MMNGKQLSDKVENAKQYKLLDYSRRQIDKILNTRITAAFIGAIAAFEDDFGFLWGHNVDDNKKTDEQKEFSEIWSKVRARILNNGNNQVRLASTEITKCITRLNRNFVRFFIKE